jgi:hypothetical protein
MKRGLLIAVMTAGVGVSLAVTTVAVFKGGARAAERSRSYLGPQPDTSSPNWKALSSDVGVMIRADDRLGLRGRLYVRVDGAWLPVATDGLADVLPAVPLR